ncbi:hypothetical protein [Dehalococcoides sp. THU4]|uniref:hypothetical protein n=1 Tax=Dehalococcoides sp. THU4 TaxID=3348344 RepID=UPI0037238FBB
MKVKTKVDFHNRFDIYKNGEWIGKAENIVLDQMYTRICNFSTYFVNIHFGTGTGTTTPDRTTLFSYLGTKTAATEETIKALPTSSWTRKITLAPEEYVGETLTEVGIAYGSTASYLVTHALITDSEGNPIAISKTAIDLIEIYATVFIQLNNSAEVSFVECKFDATGFGNKLVDYFCGSSMSTIPMTIGYSGNVDGRVSTLAKLGEVAPTVTVDVANKKRSYYGRFSVDQGNERVSITEAGLEDILRFLPVTSQSVEDVAIGTGDGVTTIFNLPNGNISNLVVKKDGVEVSYAVHNDNAFVGSVPFSEYIDYNAEYAELQIAGWQCVEYEDFSISSSSGYKYSKVKESLNGKRMFGTFKGGYAYAAQIADSLQFVGKIESFTGPFRPQLILGDEAVIVDSEGSTILGLITEITHRFGKDGFYTDFTVDSGGKLGKGRLSDYIGRITKDKSSSSRVYE